MSDSKKLLAAIDSGNVNDVRKLIARGVDVNKVIRDELSPLSAAVLLGNVEIFKALVAAGGDINRVDPPLIFDSLILGSCRDEMVVALLELGVDVRATHPENGSTPLHFAAGAASADVVKRFIAMGAPVNARDAEGQTPLHAAATWTRLDTMHSLLSAGADADARASNGARPFELFVESIRGAAMRQSMFGEGDDQSTAGIGISGVANILNAAVRTGSQSEYTLPAGSDALIDAFASAGTDFAAPCRDGSGLLTLTRAAGWPADAIAKLASLGGLEGEPVERDEDADVDEYDDQSARLVSGVEERGEARGFLASIKKLFRAS